MGLAKATMAVVIGAALLVGCSPTPSQGPPPVPHQAFKEECVVCHREGKNGAPKMTHPSRGSCGNCHRSS